MGSGVSKDSKNNEMGTQRLWKECEQVFETVSTKMDFGEAFSLLPEVMHLLRDVSYLDWTSLETHKLLFFVRTYSGPLPNVTHEQRCKWVDALHREDMMFLFTKWWKILFCRGMFNKAKEDKLRNTRMVIGIGWNCVEVSYNCCQALVDNQGFNRLISALNDTSLSPKKLQDDRSNVSRLYTAHACATMIFIILKTIIYAKQVFRDANGMEICKKYLKCNLDILKCKSLLILAYSVNEDEYSILGNQDNSIQYLLKLLNDCLFHTDHIGKLYPFLAMELIEGINKIAVNEDNKRKLIRHGVLEPLGRVVETPINEDELIAALEVIWTLSFHPENKLTIISLDHLLHAIGQLREKSDSKAVVKFASGILFTLGLLQPLRLNEQSHELDNIPLAINDETTKFADDDEWGDLHQGQSAQSAHIERTPSQNQLIRRRSQLPPPSPLPPGGFAHPPPPPLPPPPLPPAIDATSTGQEKINKPSPPKESSSRPSSCGHSHGHGQQKPGGHIMISYQWGYKPMAIIIKDKLKAAGCNVWMDVEQMTGSTLESMAYAIEGASTVIICFSESYKNSPSCRTEAEYTYKLRKRYIPIRLQSKYTADGWLGIMLGTKLYFDMSAQDKADANFPSFYKELINEEQKDKEGHNTKLAGGSRSSEVANWNQSDVQKWLSDLNLPKLNKILAAFDGKTLLALKKMCLKAPSFYYASLKNDFGLKDMVLMLRFTNALESL